MTERIEVLEDVERDRSARASEALKQLKLSLGMVAAGSTMFGVGVVTIFSGEVALGSLTAVYGAGMSGLAGNELLQQVSDLAQATAEGAVARHDLEALESE